MKTISKQFGLEFLVYPFIGIAVLLFKVIAMNQVPQRTIINGSKISSDALLKIISNNPNIKITPRIPQEPEPKDVAVPASSTNPGHHMVFIKTEEDEDEEVEGGSPTPVPTKKDVPPKKQYVIVRKSSVPNILKRRSDTETEQLSVPMRVNIGGKMVPVKRLRLDRERPPVTVPDKITQRDAELPPVRTPFKLKPAAQLIRQDLAKEKSTFQPQFIPLEVQPEPVQIPEEYPEPPPTETNPTLSKFNSHISQLNNY